MPGNWTFDRIQILTSGYNNGVSVVEICAQLGGGLSRSSVTGKANRLGLVHTNSPMLRRAKSSGVSRRQKLTRIILPAPVAPVVSGDGAPTPMNLDLFQLKERDCRWVHGDGPFLFCGHNQTENSKYCSYHSNLAYVRRGQNGNSRDT